MMLCLDLGTNTGWALIDGTAIQSGVSNFKVGRYEGGGMRYLRFKRWLTDIKNTQAFDLVYFEEVRRHISTDSSHVYGGLMATLTLWCESHEIAYQGVPVGTIKKHLTGKGNASKEQMIAGVKQRGYNPEDDNEADAIALALWAIDNNLIAPLTD